MLMHATMAVTAAIMFSATAALGALPAPLVVVTGGYDSCVDDGQGGVSPFGSNFTAAGVQMINELHAHYSSPDVNWRGMSDGGIRWLFSCFTRSSELYVQGSSDGGVVGAQDLTALTDRIGSLSEDYRRPIFVIGHSHGGWLAMRVVEALRKPIVGGFLATLDPISFVECNASTFADALLAWSAWDYLAPCRQAPGDFTAGDVQRIRTNLAGHQWKHYWQNHFVPLHSGEIPGGPDFSLDMSPFFSIMSDGAASSWSAHTRIAYLSSIWFGLKASIQNVYEAHL